MDIQGNFYRCNKCSRITQSYPLGCRQKNCPVKTDVKNDVLYGSFLYFCILGIVFLVVMFGFHYASIHSPHYNKSVDFSVEKRYTK